VNLIRARFPGLVSYSLISSQPTVYLFGSVFSSRAGREGKDGGVLVGLCLFFYLPELGVGCEMMMMMR
jgi:hypothetical protein